MTSPAAKPKSNLPRLIVLMLIGVGIPCLLPLVGDRKEFWVYASPYAQALVAADISLHEEITVDGTTRHYRLVVPHTLPKPAPIVCAFHGIGDSPESMANYSRLDRLAARKGFLLVYLGARKAMWATEGAKADNLNTNADVRFFDQLLIHLSQQYEIDRERIYAVGMSNGASFVQLLATARSNQIAAIAACAGPKPRDIGSSKNPRPVLLLVGANDLASRGLESEVNHYRADGHVVEFVSVSGLGHEWPTGHNAAIWNFLSQYSLAKNPGGLGPARNEPRTQ
jgi:polyhydroxybutyrate depolymerase